MATTSDTIGPATSGPSPSVQSTSVARNFKPATGSVLVNAFSMLAAILEIAAGGPLIVVAILAAATFNALALATVYIRRGA
jgi:hypothetical protein